MSGRGRELNVRITAQDDASDVVDDVDDRLSRLTDEDRELVLRAQAKQFERELEMQIRKLRDIETLTDEQFELTLVARDKASSKLDEVRRQLEQLERSGEDVEGSFREVETAGARMAQALQSEADSMIAEIDATATAVRAMQRALDGTDLDATEVVADLKRAGLTAAEVEADVDQLAAALKRTSDVRVHAAKMGFNDVGQAVNRVGQESTRAGDASRGFLGGMVGDSASAVTGIGPLGEAISQLTEGVAEGEVRFKQLATAGLAMGAVALVFHQIGKAKEQAAKVEAFNTEAAEAYTEALGEANTALEAVTNTLREAGKVELNLFGNTHDVTAELARFGLTVEQFSELVVGGRPKIQEWSTALEEAGFSAEDAGAVIAAASQQHEALIKAQEAAAATSAVFATVQDDLAANLEATARGAATAAGEALAMAAATAAAESAAEDLTAALEDEAAQLEENVERLNEQVEARRAAVDATYALREEQRQWNETLVEAGEQLDDLKEGTDEYQAVLDGTALAAADLADASVRVADEQATAAGRTLSATERIDAFNRSMLTSAASASGPLRQAILGYIGAMNEIPASKMTEIHAAIDRGDLAEAERLLNGTSRSRQASVEADADTREAERKLDLAARDRTARINVRTVGGGGGLPTFRYARGTKGAARGLAVVGEEGPELVDFGGGEKVRSAPATAATMRSEPPRGGGTTIINMPSGVRPESVTRAARKYERVQGPL